MASPPICLKKFELAANLTKLPDWTPKLRNLVKLKLVRSGLTEDPMRVLHTLPNLLRLVLAEAYNGKQVHIKQGGFPKLQELSLFDLKGLKFIKIEDGAMPLLEHLVTWKCPLLKEIPIGIENLRNLQKLHFVEMLKEIESGLLTHETLAKLKHIPKVIVASKAEGGKYIFRSVTSVKDILDLQPKSVDATSEIKGG